MKDQQTTKHNIIAIEFDERIAPGFYGFTADQMDSIKNAYIANRMDNYCEWYARHIRALGELVLEYGPEYLEGLYREQVADGDTPDEAFISIVCTALERDF